MSRPNYEQGYDSYDDFLKPSPWTEIHSSDHVNTINLLNTEHNHEQKERERFEKATRRDEKRQRSELQSQARREKLRSYLGDRRQKTVFILFGFIIALALILYFCLPRIPAIDWADQSDITSFTSDNATGSYSISPTSFDWSGNISIEVDSRGSWIDTKMTGLTASVQDLGTNEEIGTGSVSNSIILPGRGLTTIKIPILFAGTYTSPNETTFADVVRACSTNSTDRILPIVVSLTFKIAGSIGTKGAKIQSGVTECPVRLNQI